MMETKTTTCGSKHAFTLVELLTVVVIVGLLAGVSMMMVGHDDVYYAAGTARTIEQIIETAQQEAVRTQLQIVYFLPEVEYVVLMGYDKTTSQYKVLENPFGGSDGTVIYVNLQDEINSNSYMGTVNMGSGSQSMSFSPMGEPLKSDMVTPLPDTNYLLAGYGNKVFKLSIKPVTGTVRITKY